MQFLKRLFAGKGVVGGIDLGTHSVKMAQIIKTSSGFQLTKFAEGPTPALTIKDGQIIDSRALGDTVKAMLANNKMSMDRVVSAVSGQSVVIRPIIMTQMNERELQNAIKFEAERYLPYSVADAQIKGTILRKSVEGEEKTMEVLLVAAPNEMVTTTQEVIKMAGITPLAIDLEPFALVRSARAVLSNEIVNQTIALINLGASSSSINIFKEGILRHNRTITTAGNSFTKAIGQSLNLSFEEAEKIKKEKGVIRVEKDATPVAPTTMRIFNVIIPVLNDLVTEIQRSFDFYRARYRGESVDKILLSGGTAKFKNIDAYMSTELGVPCEVSNPFENIEITDIPGYTQEELMEIAPTLMVVVGLALRQII
ncbi:MAG: type IV pilus assembly protein PilM [Candidatus Eremiobacteraeota bacterium]|nr:type IV pilus assembly protein PilM [Candidatus Eremiobacteraeota bacterium]